ncbi:hypothetical protein LCGC14_0541270 [marine sediment metagenome]|uniref:Uncharacterized protein n=1 Tax=marine sediment metagenome TaxID=412755 RepID=A0A0F9V0Y1_9ZZZZ
MVVQQKAKTEKRKCPPHYFIVGSDNIGHCKYCPEERNFMELLRRTGVFVVEGKRGAKKATTGKKRGRKKKEDQA